LQFNGFALSWADSAKLEFGTNAQAGIQIWDGFLNRDLIIPDINFWYSMSFLVIEKTTHETMKGFCEAGFGVFSKPGIMNNLRMFLRIDFEVHIGFDKKTYQHTNGTVNQAAVDAAGDGLATSLAGGNASALGDNATTSRHLSLEDLEGLRYEDVDANSNTAKRRLNVDDPHRDPFQSLPDCHALPRPRMSHGRHSLTFMPLS
jgi:hypothetical protein